MKMATKYKSYKYTNYGLYRFGEEQVIHDLPAPAVGAS